ncbi:transposase [Streptomyces sp. NPDC055134]
MDRRAGRLRLGLADDATAVTAAQPRDVVVRLVRAGQWRPGDADILVVMDSGYDVTRLAHGRGCVWRGWPATVSGVTRRPRPD